MVTLCLDPSPWEKVKYGWVSPKIFPSFFAGNFGEVTVNGMKMGIFLSGLGRQGICSADQGMGDQGQDPGVRVVLEIPKQAKYSAQLHGIKRAATTHMKSSTSDTYCSFKEWMDME